MLRQEKFYGTAYEKKNITLQHINEYMFKLRPIAVWYSNIRAFHYTRLYYFIYSFNNYFAYYRLYSTNEKDQSVYKP